MPTAPPALTGFSAKSDTRRVNASLDKGGVSLVLSPDLNSCLDDNPLDVTSKHTRGFPSDYHPAREYERQGVDKASLLLYSFGKGVEETDLSSGVSRIQGVLYSVSVFS